MVLSFTLRSSLALETKNRSTFSGINIYIWYGVMDKTVKSILFWIFFQVRVYWGLWVCYWINPSEERQRSSFVCESFTYKIRDLAWSYYNVFTLIINKQNENDDFFCLPYKQATKSIKIPADSLSVYISHLNSYHKILI